MNTWIRKKQSELDNEFGALLLTSIDRKSIKKKKQKQQTKCVDEKLQSIIDFTTGPTIDLYFVCGCFGSFHQVINNCIKCGRVICSSEGERPCPYCGTLVFSNETLNDSVVMEKIKKDLEEKIITQNFIPICQRNMQYVSIEQHDIPLKMSDLDDDWFYDIDPTLI